MNKLKEHQNREKIEVSTSLKKGNENLQPVSRKRICEIHKEKLIKLLFYLVTQIVLCHIFHLDFNI